MRSFKRAFVRLWLMLVLASCLSSASMLLSAPTAGDLNMDGRVNIVDVVRLLISMHRGLPDSRANLDRSRDSLVTSTDLDELFRLARGEQPLEFHDLTVTNITGNAFAVCWRTNRPASHARVRFGYSPGRLNMDTGDTSAKSAEPSRLHLVQLSLLIPDTTVYFEALADGVHHFPGDSLFSAVTFQQPFNPPFINLQGTVTDSDGNPREGVLVHSVVNNPVAAGEEPDSSMWFSVLSRADGTFPLNFGNYRTPEGKAMRYYRGESWLRLYLLSGEGATATDSVLLDASTGGYQLLGELILE